MEKLLAAQRHLSQTFGLPIAKKGFSQPDEFVGNLSFGGVKRAGKQFRFYLELPATISLERLREHFTAPKLPFFPSGKSDSVATHLKKELEQVTGQEVTVGSYSYAHPIQGGPLKIRITVPENHPLLAPHSETLEEMKRQKHWSGRNKFAAIVSRAIEEEYKKFSAGHAKN